MKRSRGARLRHALVHAQILTAAADLFRERGYRATTLEAVARRVGASKATLYAYFPSKEALLAAIFDRTMRLFEEGMGAIRRERRGPAETLRRVIRHHVRAVIAERSFLTVFFAEEPSLPPPLARAIRRRKARYDRAVGAIVAAGVRQGVFLAPEPRLAVFGLLGMTNWVYQWYDPRGAWDAEAVAEGFIRLLERGYLATPGGRAAAVGERLGRLEAEIRALRRAIRPLPRRRRGPYTGGTVRRSRGAEGGRSR